MALSDVLNNLTGARDALVTAINGKGGTVAASATLRQCAEAVTALQCGGGMEFYLCISVDAVEKKWQGKKVEKNESGWAVSENLISELSFENDLPDVGFVYNSNATIKVARMFNAIFQKAMAYYKFDGNLNDSAHNYNGESNIQADYSDGKIFECINISSSNNKIYLSGKPSVRGSGSITYSAWVKHEFSASAEKEFYLIIEISSDITGYTRAAMGVSGDAKLFGFCRTNVTGDNGAGKKVYSTENLTQNEWHFVVVVFDLSNGAIRLYIDANEAGELSVEVSSFVDTEPAHVRIAEFSDDSFFGNILIDEAAIWEDALTQQEIDYLYNDGNGKNFI